GGQRQRLAIARAIIDKPEIYIFDDSFSALDFKTDAKVRRLLSEETTEALTFIVAQRVSSITNADQIIVLNEGEIVDIGTHQELLQNRDRKSTRLNSSHVSISYAVFCLKKNRNGEQIHPVK